MDEENKKKHVKKGFKIKLTIVQKCKRRGGGERLRSRFSLRLAHIWSVPVRFCDCEKHSENQFLTRFQF